ncbi:hypothetical protein [Aquabacterium sp. CECT 9606]|uniref:hypothetical protein n=1 Tax=Aquabacterium sp. CECT 9606 TaxID=2845822 RepID=UPI001E318DC1|nr:hypothetical protein [Aquabacterium sp. CECT 9606]CAH0354828.1 hypothetical protein AQB9606_03962 [Aquabacterium sp. CECT 9606]
MTRSIYGIWERGHTDPTSIKDDLLLDRLNQTISWCLGVKDTSELRSMELRPTLFHSGPDDLTCNVGGLRERESNYRKRTRPPTTTLSGGRLLVYFPYGNLSDGASESESNGFFDIFNAPPYDTWISWFEDSQSSNSAFGSYVLCYIPPIFVPQAEAGISVNAEDCILWLDHANVQIKDRLRHLSASSHL